MFTFINRIWMFLVSFVLGMHNGYPICCVFQFCQEFFPSYVKKYDRFDTDTGYCRNLWFHDKEAPWNTNLNGYVPCDRCISEYRNNKT